MKIIGREKEKQLLTSLLKSKKPEFLAVYGRRRVGKTFLIREFFQNSFAFQLTGAANRGIGVQLEYFNLAMKKYSPAGYGEPGRAQSWIDAFDKLTNLLENAKTRPDGKLVVFFDEMSWLDTRRSGFLSALEHFWNSWGAAHPELILIVCGSVSSWIINKVLKNRGGLHNRVTQRIQLEPFTLSECSDFFLDHGIEFNRRLVADSYISVR